MFVNVFTIIIVIFMCAKVSSHIIYINAVGHSKAHLQMIAHIMFTFSS